jgi:hypothetical protein
MNATGLSRTNRLEILGLFTSNILMLVSERRSSKVKKVYRKCPIGGRGISRLLGILPSAYFNPAFFAIAFVSATIVVASLARQNLSHPFRKRLIV